MKTGKTRTLIAVLIVIALGGAFGVTSASALNLRSIITGGAVVFAVDRFGGQMNRSINTLTMNRNLGPTAATKVVPILSLGSGSYIGAAQVSGPAHSVDQVKAVAQVEGEFARDQFRARALVPVSSRGTTNIQRVSGVGVSAILDLKL